MSLILFILSVKRSRCFYSQGGLNTREHIDTEHNYWHKHKEYHEESEDETGGEQLITLQDATAGHRITRGREPWTRARSPFELASREMGRIRRINN